MDAKKLKMIVRGEKKPTFGTDPNDPWSVRAGITESQKGELHAYLKSRGINPEFVSKDTKISHAKSSEFQKWRRDHQFDDPINFVSTTAADRMKQQRAQTEEVESIDEKNVPTSPEKWARAKAQAKSKFAVYPSAYANGWASKKYKSSSNWFVPEFCATQFLPPLVVLTIVPLPPTAQPVWLLIK
jgi:hypothetical protein